MFCIQKSEMNEEWNKYYSIPLWDGVERKKGHEKKTLK